MLSVGIHENVVITEVKVESDTICNITYKSVGAEDPLAGLNASNDTSAADGNSTDIKIFAPNITNYKQELDPPEVNLRKIKEIKDQFHHILKNYVKEDDITWVAHKNIEGLDLQNLYEKVNNQSIMNKMFANLANQFVQQFEEAKTDEKFRVLFIRQSKAKHFPTLRRKYLNTQPFMEPMTVSTDQSQLRFSSYEVKNGYDNPSKIEPDSNVGQEAQDAAQLFKPVAQGD